MKNRIVIVSVFSVLLVSVSSIYGQVTFEATIQNQSVSGTDFYFDIYLQRTGSNDLYLGNAQFILTFNSSAFTSPALVLDPDDETYFNLTNSNGTSCGLYYYASTSYAIAGNQLQINVNQPGFSGQSQFNSRIAKIDNQASTHRVGRYKVSGISEPSANMNLQWVSSLLVDPRSKAFTLATTDPWTSSEATGTWTNPANQPLPIQMASFTASVVRRNGVEVAWETVSETNNYGFEIYRKRGETGEWKKITFLEGHGTTLVPHSYTYVDHAVPFGKYSYRVKQIDLDGKSETFSEMHVEIGILPGKIMLAQNYPNPFNPSTVIEFAVPQSGYTSVKVYNLLGQEVATAFAGNAEAGRINTARLNATSLPSGIYFYTLRSGGNVDTKRMVLMK